MSIWCNGHRVGDILDHWRCNADITQTSCGHYSWTRLGNWVHERWPIRCGWPRKFHMRHELPDRRPPTKVERLIWSEPKFRLWI